MWLIECEWASTRLWCVALMGGLTVGLSAYAQMPLRPSFTRAPLQAAVRDPFSPFVPPPPLPRVVRSPSKPVVQAPVAAPLQVPVLPPLDLVFMGRLHTPAGVQVLAQYQGQSVLLQPGTVLTNGYVVQGMTAKEVTLRHDAQNHVARWALPAMPAFETR